jgi:hypothetical protein
MIRAAAAEYKFKTTQFLSAEWRSKLANMTLPIILEALALSRKISGQINQRSGSIATKTRKNRKANAQSLSMIRAQLHRRSNGSMAKISMEMS